MFEPLRFLGGAPWGGVQLVSTVVPVGTGATSVANSTTTSVVLPKPACTTAQLVGLRIDAQVAAASAGTVLAQAFKRDNSGTPADRTLTGTRSLKSDVIDTSGKSYAFAITATAAVNVTFQATDMLRVDIVTNNTVSTQPTATIVALWAITKP